MGHVYRDATIKCTADVSDFRDLITIRSRVEEEGLSFLTITLPQFAKDLEQALQKGFVDATLFCRWKRQRGAVMPAFLQGITRHIFDFETGKVIKNEVPSKLRGLSDDIPTLIDAVRQICLTFKKVELECTPKRVQAAFDSFISIEQSFENFSISEEDHAQFLHVSSMLWDNMVGDFNPSNILPKHGPGNTAEKISGNQKYFWRRWHDRLEPYFPIIDSGYPLGTPLDSEELKSVTIVTEDEEQPVRVVPVPKSLKGPRIIAIEPCCMQYAQQGIRDYLYGKLESYRFTAGHINFRDQSINQRLAIEASKTGQLATIDLSDASDRVPRSLAMEMFRSNQDLYDSIEACRSTRAQLPDGTIVSPLRKFASMGSALCFPVEAMYFYTVCVVALLKDRNLSFNPSNVFKVTRMLYVYGDDIITPSANAVAILDHLQKYNCKVNLNKTFVSGSFRESCGVDAYDGHEVTPTYLNRMLPENRRQAHEIVSCVATANHFYKKGYWSTAQFLFRRIEAVIGPLPYVSETSEALGRFSYLGYVSAERWNHKLQRLEVKALVTSPVYRTDRLTGYAALSKCLLDLGAQPHKRSLTPESRSSSLERSARHGAVALKRRWVSAS
jgi:hypothetical protein